VKIKQQPILISQIEVGERLRDLDEDHVKMLQADIEKRGLLDAIWVRELGKGKYRLLAGAHRLAAVNNLEHKTIRADIWEKSADPKIDEIDDRIMEIVENLMRKELPYNQAAKQTAQLLDEESSKTSLLVTTNNKADGPKRKSRAKEGARAKVQDGVADKLAKETGSSSNALKVKASHGRAIIEAEKLADVDLTSRPMSQKEVKSVAKVTRTKVADTHKRKDGAERDRKSALKAMAEGVKPSVVEKDWTNEYFESSKPKSSDLDAVAKLMVEARAKYTDAWEQLKDLGHGSKATDLIKAMAGLIKIENDIKAEAKQEKEGTTGDPDEPSNFKAPKSKREQSDELALAVSGDQPKRRRRRAEAQ